MARYSGSGLDATRGRKYCFTATTFHAIENSYDCNSQQGRNLKNYESSAIAAASFRKPQDGGFVIARFCIRSTVIINW
ncbi:hypothetical protein WKK05_26695 [Nostoc sp. UHCC 0302]